MDQGLVVSYEPVQPHWFYYDHVDSNDLWVPFSQYDSNNLNDAFNRVTEGQEEVVATEGAHYDVLLTERIRRAAYWEEEATSVRRGTWFCKGAKDHHYIPYPEPFSERLELAFMEAMLQDQWRKTVELPTGEVVILHNPKLATQWPSMTSIDDWASTDHKNACSVKRGIENTGAEIPQGQPETIDHLVFMVHGIGPACDFRFRTIISCASSFRQAARELVETHCRVARAEARVGLVEFLPVDWHTPLHGNAGVDKVIQRISLPSIERLRNFANETLLDLFFYSSPTYCQIILDTVAMELNRLHGLFCSRHPDFQGQVSLVGHSLGSLILFDLLTNQVIGSGHPHSPEDFGRGAAAILAPSPQSSSLSATVSSVSSDGNQPSKFHRMRLISSSVDNDSFDIGVGQVSIRYPQLSFNPYMLFALGSPIGMFLTVRGLRHIDPDYSLPTCKGFYNIFHPLDPVAYRIEPLIEPNASMPPVLIPHITTNRIHLNFGQSVARLTTDLQHKMTSVLLYAWQYLSRRPSGRKLSIQSSSASQHQVSSTVPPQLERTNGISTGMLNRGRRIDYVLQQTTMESINEYLFAIQSHLCYWESEDTVLLLLREIYEESDIVFEDLPS